MSIQGLPITRDSIDKSLRYTPADRRTNDEQRRPVARNAYRFGFVLIAYVVAESAYFASGFRSNRGMAVFDAVVCVFAIGYDLANVLSDDTATVLSDDSP